MSDDVAGARHEHTDTGDRQFPESFARAVAPLTQGELTFPPPFDLVTSWALARNAETGETAMELFARDVDGSARRFCIRIHELPPDDRPGVDGREIVDCVVTGERAAAQLLAGLAAEITEGPTQ